MEKKRPQLEMIKLKMRRLMGKGRESSPRKCDIKTSFTKNTKGTSLGRKEKATTRNKNTANDKAHQ